MKVKLTQFLGANHSWAVVGWGISEALVELGHEIHLFSTDGIKHLPEKLKPYLIGYTELNKPEKIYGRTPDSDYDCQISYTAMKNFPYYLSNGSINRFGVWIYEWSGYNILPVGFAKNYKYCDKILSPSNFGKKIYIDSGVPADHVVVIPHGITEKDYRNPNQFELKTNKRFKICSNIAQNHTRKYIPGLLDAYGKAFTKKDDVCLILKTTFKPAKAPFEISVKDCLNEFYKKYKDHADLIIITDFIDNMADLYNACDAIFTMSHCEGFYFPGLEGLALGKLSIAPNHGGQLDFLNSSNSLLVEGKEVRADPKSMYWINNNNAKWFQPSIDDAVDKLRFAYQNFESINAKIDKEQILKEYNWISITKRIIELCK
jgi:hypothetical protein